MTTDTTTKFAIAIGDNAHASDMPPITYGCVEGATIRDIERFQLPYLNRYKGAEVEVHLSAGHCDVVMMTLKKHRNRDIEFETMMGEVLHNFTDLVLNIRGKNATLVIYPLRSPKDYTPVCAGLSPLASHYDQGVKILNDYIMGWGSKLNFVTIERGK